MTITKQREQKAFEAMKEALHYRNRMQAPRLLKVVVSVGVGRAKEKNRLQFIENRLSQITSQKPSSRGAKKSIASFKLRQGDIVGLQVTLRGPRMYDFLDKLLHVALPHTKDFRGISPGAIDEMGNLTIGIKEHTIFPETSDEELKDVFGFAVTIVTSARGKEEARVFFAVLGVPLSKTTASSA